MCIRFLTLYRVSQKSGTADFQYLASKKLIFLKTLLDKASSAEENYTKIIKFGWVILILFPFLEIQSFSNFAWFLRPMREEYCVGKSIPHVFWGSPLISVSFVATDQWASPKHFMEGFSRQNSSFSDRKNQAKFENDYIVKIRCSAFFGTPGITGPVYSPIWTESSTL